MNELSALVIHVNDKVKYVGDLLAIDGLKLVRGWA